MEEVTAGTPSFLPPFPADAPRDRLALARWIVDPANPLTARVAVNRAWQTLMGRGLVATSGDFGRPGAAPGRRPRRPTPPRRSGGASGPRCRDSARGPRGTRPGPPRRAGYNRRFASLVRLLHQSERQRQRFGRQRSRNWRKQLESPIFGQQSKQTFDSRKEIGKVASKC